MVCVGQSRYYPSYNILAWNVVRRIYKLGAPAGEKEEINVVGDPGIVWL